MKVAFHYHLANGALIALPLDVDGDRPFALVVEDAHRIAREAFGSCVFRTVVLPHHECLGPRPINTIIAPIVARATGEIH